LKNSRYSRLLECANLVQFGLVIGVDEYQDTQISRLEGASNDAKSLANALIEYGGFPADQVILFTSDQPPERRPTRGNILRRLSNLQTIVPKDGLLLVSFAGHGMERDRRAYLLPTDAQVNGDLALLEETAINADVIRNWIHQTGIGQVVMIIDACRNNPSEGRGEAIKPLTKTYARGFNFDVRNREVNAFVTLYATEIGQVAYEFKEKKQGYFTWALVEGLKGAAANEQGEITLAGLVKYLQEAVPKRVQLALGGDKNQRPFAVVEGYKIDDLVISAVTKGSMPSSTSKAPSESFDPAAIELSFWDTIKNSSNPEDFKAYLQQYPNGRFAALARIRSKPSVIENENKTAQKLIAKDFAFELQSCRSLGGGRVICDFAVSNESSQDRELLLCTTSACYPHPGSRMFDDLGNEYMPSQLQIGSSTNATLASLVLVPNVNCTLE
jgi:Caspase domain